MFEDHANARVMLICGPALSPGIMVTSGLKLCHGPYLVHGPTVARLYVDVCGSCYYPRPCDVATWGHVSIWGSCGFWDHTDLSGLPCYLGPWCPPGSSPEAHVWAPSPTVAMVYVDICGSSYHQRPCGIWGPCFVWSPCCCWVHTDLSGLYCCLEP